MTTLEKHEPGTFCWVELATTDLAGGKEFYSNVFGWEAAGAPMEGWPEYVLFRLGDGRVAAGGYEQPEQERSMGVPPHWNLYVYTDDVDKTVAKAVEAGATAMVPGMDTPNGRMAILTDPTGAGFCLWQSEEMPGFTVRGEAGSFSWPELVTSDTKRAATFYEDVFGWTTSEAPTGNGPPYTIFHHNGKDIGGLFPPPAPEIPNNWTVYFDVVDAEETVETAQDAGGQVMQEPLAIPEVGTFSILGDPSGAVFAILQPEQRQG